MDHNSKCCISSQQDNPKQHMASEMQPSNPYSASRRIRSIAGSRMTGKREAQIDEWALSACEWSMMKREGAKSTDIWSIFTLFWNMYPKMYPFLPFPHNRVKVSVHSTDLCDLRANFQIFWWTCYPELSSLNWIRTTIEIEFILVKKIIEWLFWF